MVFEFKDYILLVEVTLTSSSRQIAAEVEPVRRHVADAKEKLNASQKQKPVYCLFIAPSIDNNTAETFRIGVWYREDQEHYVNILPLTLDQFKQVVRLLERKYTPSQFQQLLVHCLAHRNAKTPEWKRLIQAETDRWVQQISESGTGSQSASPGC